MKRRVTKIVLFLLLGAILNVAVAWGCATISTMNSDMPNPSLAALVFLDVADLPCDPNRKLEIAYWARRGFGLCHVIMNVKCADSVDWDYSATYGWISAGWPLQ